MSRKAIAVALMAMLGAFFFTPPLRAQSPAILRPYSLAIDIGTKTATATAGAATLNKGSGVITSEALSTAAGATYTLTITNSTIAGTEMVFASVAYGTSTTGTPAIAKVQVSAGSIVVLVQNIHASAALNGTIKVAFASLEN